MWIFGQIAPNLSFQNWNGTENIHALLNAFISSICGGFAAMILLIQLAQVLVSTFTFATPKKNSGKFWHGYFSFQFGRYFVEQYEIKVFCGILGIIQAGFHGFTGLILYKEYKLTTEEWTRRAKWPFLICFDSCLLTNKLWKILVPLPHLFTRLLQCKHKWKRKSRLDGAVADFRQAYSACRLFSQHLPKSKCYQRLWH